MQSLLHSLNDSAVTKSSMAMSNLKKSCTTSRPTNPAFAVLMRQVAMISSHRWCWTSHRKVTSIRWSRAPSNTRCNADNGSGRARCAITRSIPIRTSRARSNRSLKNIEFERRHGISNVTRRSLLLLAFAPWAKGAWFTALLAFLFAFALSFGAW